MPAVIARRAFNTMRVAKVVVVCVCLLPAAGLLVGAFENTLTANPIEYITHVTGDWAFRLLLATLAITPIRRLTGQHAIIGLRRVFGLLAFFYATLHMLTYVVLDYFFRFDLMWENVSKAKYVTAGLTAFLLLVPLAATSTESMMRRLGSRWQRLHRLVYASAIAAAIHYFWLIKINLRVPAAYAGVLALLLAFRIWNGYHRRRRSPSLSGPHKGTQLTTVRSF
jgi:sulfoxide reductase heme-binding subunit YedZ